MAQVKITKIGNSMGVILPKNVIDRLMVESGDSLHIIDTKNGIELTPYDPEFAAQMEVARKVMKKRRAVLHELAK
ncbi:MAG: putative addiction module antidote [Hyphomonadaceae bacterium]|nr:MAG: putative addiction module antidote [Hyphomonadaceae bacterium]KAF0184960.1 MAG: putative addiction module antidote [Hyphomonadaceae bacterium]